MNPIQVHAVVNDDQVIRPPTGVVLPQGEIEVVVRSCGSAESSTHKSSTSARNWLLDLAAEAERAAPELPVDLASNHN